jgi:hypothetical protein
MNNTQKVITPADWPAAMSGSDGGLDAIQTMNPIAAVQTTDEHR